MRAFQGSTATGLNRHPAIYRDLRRLLGADRPSRVLVFGGSVGFEALSLTQYLPQAEVLTVEIDAEALAAARVVASRFPRIRAEVSDWDRLQAEAPFDAILCHSVFCDHPRALNTRKMIGFSFDDFAAAMERLVGFLTKDGILSLINANYAFEDTDLAADFHKLDIDVESFVPKFTPDAKISAIRDTVNGLPVLRHAPDINPAKVRAMFAGSLYSRGTHPDIVEPAAWRLPSVPVAMKPKTDVFLQDWPSIPLVSEIVLSDLLPIRTRMVLGD